ELIANQRGPGLVTHWQQRLGLLAAAGPSPLLRVWDLGSERLWTEWKVPPESCVTVLASPRDRKRGPDGGVGGFRGGVL
ncbi:unnamed protein product, partial [Laminaria digitata]